jgi:hypothetical protein
MKKVLFATAAAALAIGSGLPAQAGGCYSSLAASVIADSIRGGLSSSQAIQQAVDEGDLNNEGCLARTVGYMPSLSTLYGDVLK